MPKHPPISKSVIGAAVRYCGHEGYFMADITVIGKAAIVYASGPVTPQNICRPAPEILRQECTHHLVDFPSAGVWKPERGIFAVPVSQVKVLTREVL